ncbi:structural maintenance of chromosomes protein 4-like [Drosophila gunungcola]|uniref:RecF/RecN/SMC N-terminal domain-containing protein n=1 Tax=Drosophila gunungcola TaxID=103775 RepID=A0A9Q0BJI0_9MUSC|nr:structural maintenance of chromosomes protein 4-like [Drosophila gunungcola]KAI8034191.1 hypothetical protein M5D96_013042 [Drosophila gunungcola]
MHKANNSKGTLQRAQTGRPRAQFQVPQPTAQQQMCAQQEQEEDARKTIIGAMYSMDVIIAMHTKNAVDDDQTFFDENGLIRFSGIFNLPPVPSDCFMVNAGPRLIVVRILITNFKSFAGEVKVGPFDQSLTSIIGPNGCGKSNIIDAMMFVFGCRANRIRCSRISALIHSSSQFLNVENCSVEVHLKQIVDRADGSCEDVPSSGFVIERTAKSDNSSYYQINEKRAQLKDVAKLLAQHGVDLAHSRFLVLDSEVESIAMMKPKGQTENETGMLELLEEIVGTQCYARPMQQLTKRVDQLSDEHAVKLARCRVAELDMKALEQRFNKAVDYLKKQNEMMHTKSVRIQKILGIERTKMKQYTKEHETFGKEIETHGKGTAALRQQRAEMEAAFRKETEAYESLEKRCEQIKNRLVTAERDHTVIQMTIKATNEQRNSAVSANNRNLREDIKAEEERLKSLDEDRKKCLKQKEKLEKEADGAKSHSAEIKRQIDGITQKIFKRNIDRIDMDAKLQAAEKKLNELMGHIYEWQYQLLSLKLNEIPGDTQPQAEPLRELSEEELEAENLEALQHKQTVLEAELRATKPNLRCIKEYNEKCIVYRDLVRVLEDINAKRTELWDKYSAVRKRRYKEFIDGFHIITRKLKTAYQLLTIGGDADLELVDSMDPFNQGVNFTVRPPKKSWSRISNLSGGEKAICSLALIFALHHYKPSPLYVLDAVDASLDYKNVACVGAYIKKFMRNTQFIVISHRPNTFELGNVVLTLTSSNNCTESVTVRNHPGELSQLPGLPTKQPMNPNGQDVGETIAQDQTSPPENNENESPNSQAGPSQQVTQMGHQVDEETPSTSAQPKERIQGKARGTKRNHRKEPL